jgi:molecular chaperone HtpG
MAKGSLNIHSENILPIIKKWLYSSRDIFVRELVSNSTDAIRKLKMLGNQESDFRIDVNLNPEAKTITISDNGIGMTAEEVEKYIAQIAFSGAEDFVEQVKGKPDADQFIGHFGLGFYSAYMVADKVELQTLSYKEGAKPAFWSCDGSSEYTLEEGSRKERGTEITLHINHEGEEFLDPSKLKEVLKHFCGFMSFPIYFQGERINEKEPLWMKAPSECKEEDYREFYQVLYPYEEPPLFWMHLNVDYPFHLKGILYFPALSKDFDFAKHTVKLFCNRVFVSDNCKDVIPEYLMCLRGVIDIPDIPLNVSRSYLQVDKTVKQLSAHISKKVSDSLSSLFKSDRERYTKCWKDIAPIVKLGVIQDEKFSERMKDQLIFKTLDDAYVTLEEYKERNQAKAPGKVYYTLDEKHSSSLHELYKEKGIDLISADFRLDPYLFNQLESKNHELSFQRADAEIGEHLLDKEKENSDNTKLVEFFKRQMDDQSIAVEAKSLASTALPSMVVIDEKQRRMRDYMKSISPDSPSFAKKTLIVNTNSPLARVLPELESAHPELAKELALEVVDLSLLAQKEMDPQIFQAFLKRTTTVLEKLSALAVARHD